MNELPQFCPSQETNFICDQLPEDFNGKAMKLLLKRTDVQGQQNALIIAEQRTAADERKKLFDTMLTKKDFEGHEAKDDATRVKVDAIDSRLAGIDRWRLIIKSNWKLAMAVAIPVGTGFGGLAVWGLKLWIESMVKR